MTHKSLCIKVQFYKKREKKLSSFKYEKKTRNVLHMLIEERDRQKEERTGINQLKYCIVIFLCRG